MYDQNPSSVYDEQVERSREVHDLNETQKINCPKFKLKKPDSVKLAESKQSQNLLLDSPFQLNHEDSDSNISDSINRLFENDADLPLSQQVDGL